MKLPKSETVILLAFLVCAALWAVSKCSGHRAETIRRVRETEDSGEEERPVRRDTVPPAPQTPAEQMPLKPGPPVAQSNPPAAPTPQPGVIPRSPSTTSAPAEPSKAAPPTSGSTLFVTIDGLKVRKEPGLKGETVAELALYEPVTFLNKKTEWTQEISLGYEKVTDHWVKVRTKSGKEGWVFGAGVHYYKMKRAGVMESKKPAEEDKKKKNK